MLRRSLSSTTTSTTIATMVNIITSKCLTNPPSQEVIDRIREENKNWTKTDLHVFENPFCDNGHGQLEFGYRVLPFTVGSEVYSKHSGHKTTIVDITPGTYGFMNCRLADGSMEYSGDLVPAEIY